jgi:hypothetical protein
MRVGHGLADLVEIRSKFESGPVREDARAEVQLAPQRFLSEQCREFVVDEDRVDPNISARVDYEWTQAFAMKSPVVVSWRRPVPSSRTSQTSPRE